MLLIRPIKGKDLKELMELLKDSGHGLTSLPKDEKILSHKILQSERSFELRGEGPGGELYLFVMEDLFTGKLIGVSGLISKIGGFEPFWFYRLKTETKKSKMLNIEKEVKTLNIYKTHSGPAEICSLYLHPEFRNSQNGRFLSLSRFLFLAENEKFFEEFVIAEMRGQVNDDGHSPFWSAVGKKFMDIEFVEADYLSMKSKKFLEELLPEQPILVDLLPEDAQKVIGEVHSNTVPARRILEKEGFNFEGLVGIFEPGPILEAKVREIRAFKESRVIKIGEISNEDFNSDTYIMSTVGEGPSFRAALGKIAILKTNDAKIQAVTATGLKLKLGDSIRFVSLRPE